MSPGSFINGSPGSTKSLTSAIRKLVPGANTLLPPRPARFPGSNVQSSMSEMPVSSLKRIKKYSDDGSDSSRSPQPPAKSMLTT